MSWSQVKHINVPFFTPLSYSNRTHKLCQLPNGILLLLISDPTESVSACSLTVAAGSYNDSDDVPGVAHLCEHMLLAGGSKKYPSPGCYHDMITKNNGSYNAFTTGEQTTFYFELPDFNQAPEAGFEKAIDIFASFFSEPLFDHTLINKEIYAIQNEHDSNVSNVTKILYHATRLLGDKSHPFSRFATGNMSSLKNTLRLKGPTLRNLLSNHFRENYAPSRMTICLRGPSSVNGLAKLAISKFGELRPHKANEKVQAALTPNDGFNILQTRWGHTKAANNCFPSCLERNTICVDSGKLPIMRFLFPVWQKFTRFTKKDFLIFERFWFELFGDESAGSFCHFLVEKGWITNCYAYISRFSTDNTGLILELSLTNSGWHNIELIAQTLIFYLVPKFSREHTVQLARFLSEQFSIDLIRFLYSNAENSPMTECSNLCEVLQEDINGLDNSCIFMGSPMVLNEQSTQGLFSENEESQKWWIGQAIKFQSFLKEFMNHSNMRLILLGWLEDCSLSTTATQGKIAGTDPFYDFAYFTCKLSLRKPHANILNDYKFSIPPKNEFKPSWAENFPSLMRKLYYSSTKSQQASLGFAIKSDEGTRTPQLVSQNENYDMWVLSDCPTSSHQSKAIVSFEISCWEIQPSPENTMNLEILAQVINLTLASDLYPSLKLGFTFEIYPSSRGDVRLGLVISGYSKRLGKVIESLSSIIRRLKSEKSFPSRELFRKARISVRSNYDKAEDNSSINVASIGLLVVMEKYMWSLQDRIDAIECIDLQTFKAFAASFADYRKFLRLFIQGDLSHADDINACLDRNLTNHLHGTQTDFQREPEYCSTKLLDPATNFYVEYPGRKDDPTNSTVYYIQTGPRDDCTAYTLTALSAYMMSFTLKPELRNKRQIGYVVMGGLRLLRNAVGLHISIMSTLEPLALEEKINEYLLYLEREVLTPMTEDTFRNKYLKDFLNLQSKGNLDKLRKDSGPSDLMDQIVANVQSGDSDILNSSFMKKHKRLRNQIADGRYTFADRDSAINTTLLQELTIDHYLCFFRERISIHSKTRAKLSVMVKSPMTDEEIVNRQIYSQVDAFLKLHGLTIETAKLRELVQRSKGKPMLLAKELYQSFHSRHETWKLCTVMLRELLKMLTVNLKFRHQRQTNMAASEWGSTPATGLTLIKDINIYRKEVL